MFLFFNTSSHSRNSFAFQCKRTETLFINLHRLLMETTQCANKNKAGNYRAKVVKKVGQEGQDYILEEGRHYLFRDANSFPRAKLMENCEL